MILKNKGKMNSNEENIRPQFGHKHVYASFFAFYYSQFSTVINKAKEISFSTFKEMTDFTNPVSYQ